MARLITPARKINVSSLNGNLEEVYTITGKELEKLKFKRIQAPDASIGAIVIYQYGSPMYNFLLSDFLPVTKGYNYFVTLETISNEEMVVTVQNYQRMVKAEEVNYKYNSLFSGIQELNPAIQMTEWFEAALLPKHLLSHPISFVKNKGFFKTL